jgi:hypothetical protein
MNYKEFRVEGGRQLYKHFIKMPCGKWPFWRSTEAQPKVVTEKQDGLNGFVRDVFNLRYLWVQILTPTRPVWSWENDSTTLNLNNSYRSMPTCH